MPTKLRGTASDARVWERVIQFEEDPSPTAARALLRLKFSQSDQQRMHELAAKASAGILTPDEERLLDTYERLGCLLDIVHSKSRRILNRRRTPA